MDNLFQIGEFQLNSDRKSKFKLVCDQFIKDNLEGLAWAICVMSGPFSAVYGIPRGGSLLEEALLPHISRSVQSTVLIVDDVLTTGGSFKRAREKLAGSHNHIIGATVFARGSCPSWVRYVFQMPVDFWNL